LYIQKKRTVRVRVWSRLIQRGKEAKHKKKTIVLYEQTNKQKKLIFIINNIYTIV
jgi:hypothetical protein